MAKQSVAGKYSHLPDEHLVEIFNTGVREAFVELVHRYQGRIVNFIYRALGDFERSEELAQESFLRAFRKADSFNSKYRFSTWLYTIARNLASNELRDRSRRPTPYTIDDEDWASAGQSYVDTRGSIGQDPASVCLNKEMKEALEKALSQLSDEHRMAVILKEYDGLTYGEIADILDTSAGTVKSWVYRAKREIYRYLERDGSHIEMACEDIREDAQAYLDKELSPARRAVVEDHLRTCRECREVLKEMETVTAALGGWSARPVSNRFDFALSFKLSNESVPAADKKTDAPAAKPAQRDAAVRPASVAAVTRAPARRARPSVLRDWRALAVAATVLLAFVAMIHYGRTRRTVQPVRRSTTSMVFGALASAGSPAQMADGALFANVTARRAIAAQQLDASRVVKSDVVYSFLALAESQVDQNAGKRLVNLLAGRGEWQDPVEQPSVASIAGALAAIFGTPAYAAEIMADPLMAARQYEFQGRLREALLRYGSVSGGTAGVRARLAEGALKLRLGDLDGAETSLEQASASNDILARAMADELLSETAGARTARAPLAAARKSVITGRDWYSVGILEVKAYDFRSAANSFMKAANAAPPEETAFAADARFRSAWCQVECGQVTTGVYGFQSVTVSQGRPAEIEYAAAIEQAMGLARVGKAEDAVAALDAVQKMEAPNRSLEALSYFQKGIVELRYLKDEAAAAESLGRVANSGQGNLSYAAQVLVQTSARPE